MDFQKNEPNIDSQDLEVFKYLCETVKKYKDDVMQGEFRKQIEASNNEALKEYAGIKFTPKVSIKNKEQKAILKNQDIVQKDFEEMCKKTSTKNDG